MLLTELQTYSLTHQANIPFSSSASGDNSFCFITEKGLDILELAPDPKSVSPSLSCRRYVIKHSSDLPTANLSINPSDLLPHLDREQAYAIITDVDMSPKLTRTQSPTPTPKQAQWSPVGILNNHRCLLAVLTDVGSLCLYALSHQEYQPLGDVSQLWLNECKASWRTKVSKIDERFAELQHRAETVKLTALCWLNETEGEAGYLATATKSGFIILWRIRHTNDSMLDIQIVSQFDSGLKILTVLNWVQLSSKNSLLTAGSLDGRIRNFIVSPVPTTNETDVQTDTLSVLRTNDVWAEKDRMAPCHLVSWPWREGQMLLAVKGAFVIAFYLDSEGERQTYAAYRSCDISVNGLCRLPGDELLIVTRSSRFTRLSLELTADQNLNFITSNVNSFINISHMGCYGLHMSQNSVICFILLSVNQSYDHLRLRETSQVVVSSVSGLLEPQVYLQDCHRPISQLWDCLELLRVQILQKVVVSDLQFPRSVLDNMTIDQLTSTLWWATFATAAEEDEHKHQTLVYLRSEVETLVISCHVFKRVALLMGSDFKSLSQFQLNSLGLLRKWLENLIRLPREYSTTLITGNFLLQQLKALGDKIPDKELCGICSAAVPDLKELYFSECVEGHRMPRCCLSLVQCCQLPYWVCTQCGALAHSLAVEECGVSCTLCGGILRINEDIL